VKGPKFLWLLQLLHSLQNLEYNKQLRVKEIEEEEVVVVVEKVPTIA
jgi:hypothetical protein